MSHNHAGHVPYITDHTTALSTAGAGQTLTITGFGLSLATTVAIPAALGVETSRSYTKARATSGTLTITMTVESFAAGTLTNRSIPISMGGVPCQGAGGTSGAISVIHGFQPTHISSLQAWFDASDYNSMTIDTSETSPGSGVPKNLVGQWNDKSGNNYHAVQNTENYKPKYVASGGGIDNKHILWGTTHHHLDTPSMVWGAVSSGGYRNSSIFVVFSYVGPHGSYLDIIRGNHPAHDAIATLGVGSDDSHGLKFWASSGWQCTGGTATSALPSKVLGGWLHTDSGFVVRVNGSVDDSDSTAPATSAGSHPLRFGAYANPTNIEISEILIFNTELTGADLSSVENYLNAKWSIWT